MNFAHCDIVNPEYAEKCKGRLLLKSQKTNWTNVLEPHFSLLQ
jgi:hypothetical protein